MDIRKIQKVGTGTLCISLPKKWAQDFNIDYGAMMQVSPRADGSIEIKPFQGPETDRAETYRIQIKDIHHSGKLKRLLIGCYVVGYNKVHIQSERDFTQELIKDVRDTKEQLIGASIVHEGTHDIHLSYTVDISKYDLEGLLRREVELVASIYVPILKIMQTPEPTITPKLRELEREIDTSYWLSLRYILTVQNNIKRGLKHESLNPLELLESRTIFRCLENAADSARSIISIIENTKDRSNKQFDDQLFSHLNSICDLGTYMLKDALEAVLTHNASAADDLIQRTPNLKAMVERFQDWLAGSDYELSEVLLAHHIALCLSNLGSCSTIISEIAINRALDKDVAESSTGSDKKEMNGNSR